jgi:hypothetical protein
MSDMKHAALPGRGLQTAWNICARAANPSTLAFEILVGALQHGVHLAAVSSPSTMDESRRPDHVSAARVFTALQLKLQRSRGSLDVVSAARLRALLGSLPATWAVTLRRLLVEADEQETTATALEAIPAPAAQATAAGTLPC